MKVLKTAILVAALVLVCGSSQAAIRHDNYVTINWNGGGSATMSFTCEGYDITSGQPWGGVSSSQSGNSLKILVKAGRHGSSSVASNFNNTLSQYGSALAVAHADQEPGELNFYVYGTLNINGNSYKVSIGQGHDYTLGFNNWWIGGPDLSGFRARRMIATADGKYTFSLTWDLSDDTFNVDSNTTAPSWMAFVSDDSTLTGYSIPGTHDTGTYGLDDTSVVNTFAVCQDYDVLTQLNLGVRVLDIRLGLNSSGNMLMIYHSSLETYVSFQAVLEQTFRFLRANPTETVVMIVKQETGSEDLSSYFYTTLYMFDPTMDLYWLEDSMPQLGQVRGKIVFVNRDQQVGNYGINVDWHDNCTFTSDGNVDFMIQDQYEYSDAQTKVAAFDALLDEIIANPTQYWYINYLSAEGIGLKAIAEEVDPLAYQSLTSSPYASATSVGTVMLNYAGEVGTPEIINNMLIRDIPLPPASKVSFSSTHAESQKGAQDKYNINLYLTLHNGMDPTKFLHSNSKVILTFGSYSLEATLGDNSKAKFISGKRGKITFNHINQDAMNISWDKKGVTIKINSKQAMDGGFNLLDLSGHKGSVSGKLDYDVAIDWLKWSGTLSYKGKAAIKYDSKTHEPRQSWNVKSTKATGRVSTSKVNKSKWKISVSN